MVNIISARDSAVCLGCCQSSVNAKVCPVRDGQKSKFLDHSPRCGVSGRNYAKRVGSAFPDTKVDHSLNQFTCNIEPSIIVSYPDSFNPNVLFVWAKRNMR